MAKPAATKFRWFILTPFLKGNDRSWLSAFIHRESVTFEYVNTRYRHARWRTKTSWMQWIDYFGQSIRANVAATKSQHEGTVTVFPQLAFTMAFFKLIFRSKKTLIAWCFNVGSMPSGIRRKFAAVVLRKVDLFVVHSSAEIEAISQGFNIPKSKVVFLPLQRPLMPQTHPMDVTSPFIIALGTAQRDYKTLIDAMAGLDIALSIVASQESVAGLSIPNNVTIYEKLSSEECHILIQRSTFVVTPLKASSTAAGQVTLLDAMMYERASVSTNVVGTIDYALDGATTLLVPPSDVTALRAAILKLWNDVPFRKAMQANALEFVRDKLSDENLAAQLDHILQDFEHKTIPPLQSA
jgi:glycosyltransferase involved in cell wall biosynthesis